MDVKKAHEILKQIDCLHSQDSPLPSNDILRLALQTVASQSDFQIFGVCASSLDECINALSNYVQALGYTLPSGYQLDKIDGAAYVKFNPKANLIYADSYQGNHRGVLVSCQSAYENGLNEMYGHLPLNLFTS